MPVGGVDILRGGCERRTTRPRAQSRRELKDQADDPDEVLVPDDGAIDQHHRPRRIAVLIHQPPPEVEQHDNESLILVAPAINGRFPQSASAIR